MALRASLKKQNAFTKFAIGDRVNVPKRYFLKADLPDEKKTFV